MAGFGLMAVLFLNPTANLFLNFYEIIFRFTGNRKGLRLRWFRFDGYNKNREMKYCLYKKAQINGDDVRYIISI